MKFEEILEPLKNGKKVRRKCWAKDCFIEFDENKVLSYVGTIYTVSYVLSLEDLTATNWEMYHKFILDIGEREYLTNIIRPFKQKVLWVCKQKSGSRPSHCFLVIGLKNAISDIWLPPFKANSMYKNMKLDKHYTLEELGLCQSEKL